MLATLVIYAYSSFAASWGPGPEIAKRFEKICQCKVQIVDVRDGGAMLSRLKLEGDKIQADVVVGIDETVIGKYKTELKWQGEFKAFDFGPYAFVYNSKTVTDPPQSLDDLLDPKWKGQIAVEDPRLSTPGLGFLLWVIREKGEKGAWHFFRKFKDQVKVVSPSWDLAYGMFKKGKAKLVFSYWTSPAYHIQEEKNHDFRAAKFSHGHFSQREYFVLNSKSKNLDLAKKFSEFFLGEEAQGLIPLKNFMYPVNKSVKLTPAFEELGAVQVLKSFTDDELKKINEWLKNWREIFS